jgi:hypothetical protein
MPLEVINVDHENGTVGVTWEWDANCLSLANFYVRWVPMVPELRELGRAIAQLQPELEVKWPKGMEFWWAAQQFAVVPATNAHPICANEWMSLYLEINMSLQSLSGTPVVVLQVPDNPRAFWQPIASSPGAAFWMVRPADFLAIMILLIRFTEIEVTANNKLWAETRKEFRDLAPFPHHRMQL